MNLRAPQTSKTGLRAAFALPIVLVVILIGGSMLVVALDRQSVQSRSAMRVEQGYDEFHTSRGLLQIIETWLRSGGNRPLLDRLDEQGMAFSLNVRGQPPVRVYMEDAQGSVLTDVLYLTGNSGRDAQRLLLSMREAAAGDPDPTRFFRAAGPTQVSVHTAPPEVLRALVTSTVGAGYADAFIDSLLKSRQQQRLRSTDIVAALNAATVPAGRTRNRLNRLMTVNPQLWKVEVEIGDPGNVTARYRGVLQNRPPDRTGASGPFQRRLSVISWEKISATEQP
jgi:hypothetical protein